MTGRHDQYYASILCIINHIDFKGHIWLIVKMNRQSVLSLLIKFETAILREERVPLIIDDYYWPLLFENTKPITNNSILYADISLWSHYIFNGEGLHSPFISIISTGCISMDLILYSIPLQLLYKITFTLIVYAVNVKVIDREASTWKLISSAKFEAAMTTES